MGDYMFSLHKRSFDLLGKVSKTNLKNRDRITSTPNKDYIYDENWTYKRKTSTPIKWFQQGTPKKWLQQSKDLKNNGVNLGRGLQIVSSKIPIFKREKAYSIDKKKNISTGKLPKLCGIKKKIDKKLECVPSASTDCSMIPKTGNTCTMDKTQENIGKPMGQVSINPMPNFEVNSAGVVKLTMQMTIWTNQLNRLKRRTERLREKDNQLKQKYEELKQRTKRVLSEDDEPQENLGGSPPKRARVEDVTNKLKNCSLRPKKNKTPSRIPHLRNNVFSYAKARSLFDKHVTKEKLFGNQNKNGTLNSTSSDILFTFLKNGKKCTIC